MPNRLFKLLPSEISFVPRGANNRRYTVLKEDKGKAAPTKMTDEQKSRVDKVLKELVAAPKTAVATNPDPAAKVAPNLLTDEAPQTPDPGMLAAMKSAARILAPYHSKLSMPLMQQIGEAIGVQDATGIDALATGQALPPDTGEEADDGDALNASEDDNDGDESFESDADLLDDLDIPQPDGVSDQDHEEGKHAAKQAYAESLKQKDIQLTRKGDKPDGDAKEKDKMPAEVKKEGQASDNTQDLLKQLLEGQQALLASQQELSGRQAKIEKEFDTDRAARVEREEKRVLKEYEDQALRDFKHLGVDAAKFAQVSKVLKEHNPEAHASMVQILKAADAQVQDGGSIFEARGTTTSGQTEQTGGFASERSNVAKSDAESAIDQVVRGLVQKDAGSTYEQKYTEFLNTPRGQEMYAQYEIEQEKLGNRDA